MLCLIVMDVAAILIRVEAMVRLAPLGSQDTDRVLHKEGNV
jgi:hypothetical protein